MNNPPEAGDRRVQEVQRALGWDDDPQGCRDGCTVEEGGWPALCHMYPRETHPGCARQAAWHAVTRSEETPDAAE